MQRASQLAPRELYKGSKPLEDRAYSRFICRLFCLVCGTQRGPEGANAGPRGLGQRTSDRSRIPLCHKHHRTGNDSLNKLGPVQFSQHHKSHLSAVVETLNTQYDGRIARSIK